MGLRVNTNIASLTAQRNLGSVSSRLQGNFARLSSGLRIATAADDAAGLAISERLRSQTRSLAVNGRNAQDGISLVQTAEGALAEVSNQLSRLRELAIQSSNGTLGSSDRATLDAEYQAIREEIERVAGEANFNGVQLLDNAASVSIQVGLDAPDTIDIDTVDISQAAGGSVGSLGNILTAGAASTELAAIDLAIDEVTTARGDLGAAQNRLQSTFASIQNVRENLSAAESRIRDVDVAAETADLTRNSILQQAATSVLAQANVQPQLALSLLG